MGHIDRRQFLGTSSAFAFVGLLPACASVAPAPAPAFANAVAGDAEAQRLLAEIAERLLTEYPENASALGIDKDARATLKSQLTDRSHAGYRQDALKALARLGQLRAIDAASLSPAARMDLEVVRTAHEIAVDGYRFPYGEVALLNSQWSYRNSPYAVAQNTGAFVEIPDFLDTNHSVATAADAEAYLARLEAYAAALDGETERLRHDASLGVILPDFLLDKTLKQMRGARAEPVAQWGLVTSIARRTENIPGNYGPRAERIVAERVVPALDRQIAELTSHRARATSDAGVWKLPQGDAFYAWALRAATTSNLTPDQVHQLGLDQLEELSAQMDPLLRAQGLTQGTVGQRMTQLGKDPKHLYPNTDAGRAQILEYVNGRVDDVRGRLSRAFNTLVPGRLIVKRVPPEIEVGAPRGYAAAGTMDGSVPGNYYINLRDTTGWPRYSLPTLTYHEGIPGHIWQGEYSYKLPLIRSLLGFSAYAEGWALYAEQLADELGVYQGDPLGQLGYLQSMAYRACRLVVDSGLHAKRWSRDRAIDWFSTTSGVTRGDAEAEVDRYCAWPGQACAYKVGHIEINRLRDKARAALGARYDYKAFNDAVVKTGSIPLTLLEQVIDAHITERWA